MIPSGAQWVPVAILTALGLYAAALKARRRRNDMQWAAEAAERVRIAECLAWMERDLAGTDLEVLAAMFLDERGRP